MESANISREELKKLIFYVIKENNVDIEKINNRRINSILDEYYSFCYYFKINYVRGELDTFKRAACLMVAINKGRIIPDKRLNASIAIDAAYKMCEKPYWNIGENCDIPKKLEEVDFKKVFKNDMYCYNTSRNMLIDSLVYENGTPLNYFLNLELFYQIALQIQPKNLPKEKTAEEPQTNNHFNEQQKKENFGNKLLRILKKR